MDAVASNRGEVQLLQCDATVLCWTLPMVRIPFLCRIQRRSRELQTVQYLPQESRLNQPHDTESASLHAD